MTTSRPSRARSKTGSSTTSEAAAAETRRTRARGRAAIGLLDLPAGLIEHILALALQLELASSSSQQQQQLAHVLLYGVGNRQIAHHTQAMLWSTLTLPDDDEVVIYAENESRLALSRRPPTASASALTTTTSGGDDEDDDDHEDEQLVRRPLKSLSSLYSDARMAQLVHHLSVVKPIRFNTFEDAPFFPFAIDLSPSSSPVVAAVAPAAPRRRHPHISSAISPAAAPTTFPTPTSSATNSWEHDHDYDPDHGLDFDTNHDRAASTPLQDTSLLLLLSKLASLGSFEWKAARHPPTVLCSALGTVAKGLTSFTFDLDESDEHIESPVASPHLFLATSPSRSLGNPIGLGGAPQLRVQRWDATELSALPISLTHLSLSHLSQKGAQELAAALPSLPALDRLELGKSVFIDDALLGEIGQSAKRVTKLRLFDLPGTKLTEIGIGKVIDGCAAIEVLELDCVEGRLPKSTWSKLSPLPDSLHTLSFTYHELPSPPHKSWVLDHLSSLPGAISESSSLRSLTVSRRIEDVARIPGQHWISLHPIDPVVAPRPLPTALVEALVGRGVGWKKLNLDLWNVDAEVMKKLMHACTGLVKLQVMYDAPFRNVLSLASSFAVAHELRHFVVSIDPSHAPELASAASSTQLLTPSQSPSSTFSSLPTVTQAADLPASPPQSYHARRSSTSVSTSPSGSTLSPDQLGSVAPVTRDWRRFLKKTLALESITWTGRGGLGTWFFERTGSLSSNIKIEFEPTRSEGEVGVDRLRELAPVPLEARGAKRQTKVSLEGTALEGLQVDRSDVVEQARSPNTFAAAAVRSFTSSSTPTSSSVSTFAESIDRSSTPPIGTWATRSHVEQQPQQQIPSPASTSSTGGTKRGQQWRRQSSSSSSIECVGGLSGKRLSTSPPETNKGPRVTGSTGSKTNLPSSPPSGGTGRMPPMHGTGIGAEMKRKTSASGVVTGQSWSAVARGGHWRGEPKSSSSGSGGPSFPGIVEGSGPNQTPGGGSASEGGASSAASRGGRGGGKGGE